MFFKSPMSERLQDASSDFCKTLLADSRQPRSQPPTKPRRQAAHTSRASLIRPHPHTKKDSAATQSRVSHEASLYLINISISHAYLCLSQQVPKSIMQPILLKISEQTGFSDAGNLLKPFSKSPNSLRSNSELLKNNADSHRLRSAPLLQSPATGSTRLTGWLFRAGWESGEVVVWFRRNG